MQRLTLNVYLCALFRLYLWKNVKTGSRRYKTNFITNSEYRTNNDILYYEIYHYVLYVYIYFHLAALVTRQQEKLGTNLCDNFTDPN